MTGSNGILVLKTGIYPKSTALADALSQLSGDRVEMISMSDVDLDSIIWRDVLWAIMDAGSVIVV